GRGERGGVSRGGGGGAWVLAAAGADRGAVRGGPVRGAGQPDVPDRGCRALVGRRDGGVSGPRRRAGQAAGRSDRVGRDRSAARRVCGRAGGGGGAAGGRRGPAPGGVLHDAP